MGNASTSRSSSRGRGVLQHQSDRQPLRNCDLSTSTSPVREGKWIVDAVASACSYALAEPQQDHPRGVCAGATLPILPKQVDEPEAEADSGGLRSLRHPCIRWTICELFRYLLDNRESGGDVNGTDSNLGIFT